MQTFEESARVELRSLVTEYTRYRLRGARETTRQKHLWAIDKWAKLLGREPVVSDLSDDAVSDLLWSLLEADGLKPPTANMYGAKLRALWTFAARRGLTAVWPTFAKIPEETEPPVAFTQTELSQLFDAISNTPGSIAGICAAAWWRSLCLTLWDTAERISATLSARWGDLAGNVLTIRAAARKGRSGSRRAAVYRLHPDTVQTIGMIRGDRELIWPWPFHTTTLWLHWNRILQRAGLATDRYHKFHCFRRSVASYAQAGGLDAASLLGHSDRRITETSYLSPAIVTRPAACDVVFRPNSSQSSS